MILDKLYNSLMKNIREQLPQIKELKKIKEKYNSRARKIFDKKSSIIFIIITIFTKSIPLVYIIGDGLYSWKLYKNQQIKEHILRLFRILIGIIWFVGILNPIIAGSLLIIDGSYSIFRYRYYNVTKSIIEDSTRFIRIFVGILIISPLPLTLSSFWVF